MSGLPKEMVEAMALRWAAMDGKQQRFLDDKAGLLSEEDGCYEGYMVEAEELLKAALTASIDAWHPQVDYREPFADREENERLTRIAHQLPWAEKCVRLEEENERLKAALETAAKGAISQLEACHAYRDRAVAAEAQIERLKLDQAEAIREGIKAVGEVRSTLTTVETRERALLDLIETAEDLVLTSIKRMRAAHVGCLDLQNTAEEFLRSKRLVLKEEEL